MRRLNGKVTLVPGGTSANGAATVQRFAGKGAAVVFTGRNVEAVERVNRATGGHIDGGLTAGLQGI